jgi:hypothetical protein
MTIVPLNEREGAGYVIAALDLRVALIGRHI